MAFNQKLTTLVAGKIVNSILQEEGKFWIIFADGSEMRIKTLDPAPHVSIIGRAVHRVLQAGTAMTIVLDDDTTFEITLAGPTSSVMLRSKNCVLEYAD